MGRSGAPYSQSALSALLTLSSSSGKVAAESLWESWDRVESGMEIV